MAITLVPDTYYQVIEDESSDVVTVDGDNTFAIVCYLIKGGSIISFINDVLGSAKLQTNSYISRTIPASNPLFPWLYAYKIESIKGYTVNGKEDSVLVKNDTTYKNIDSKIPEYVGSYKYYKVYVRFQNRNYNVYSNEQLQPYYEPAQYYMPKFDPTTNFWSETVEDWTYRLEESRYTNFSKNPKVELLSYGGGNFWCKSGVLDINPSEFPISNDGGGQNQQRITKFEVDINLFFVPFEYSIKNQCWLDGYSKLNQYDFLGFKKGSLLFQTVEVFKYEPYYPFLNVDLTSNSSVYDYYTEYNKNQYCDVKFKCQYFNLPEGVKVTPKVGTYLDLNCKDTNSAWNRVMSPKNLFWYYVESNNSVNKEKAAPLYWSYDFARLLAYQESA